MFGSTQTNKASLTQTVLKTYYGAELTVTKSVGISKGESGIITIDASTNNGEIDGGSITIGGILTLGYGTDGSVSAGLGIAGYEGHIGAGVGNGLGQVSIGGSHTDDKGVSNGSDATYKLGGPQLLLPVLLLNPGTVFSF